MKKRLIFSVLLFVGLLMTIGFSMADSILDFLDFANSKVDEFGYTSGDKLMIKQVYDTEVDVSSPIVKRQSSDVTAYLFDVSTTMGNANPVAYWCFYDLGDGVTINGNKFSVSLDLVSAGLNKNEVYYVYAIPVDPSLAKWTNGLCSAAEAGTLLDKWIWWNTSTTNWENPCFIIEWWIYWVDNSCSEHKLDTIWSSTIVASSSNDNGTSPYAIRQVSHTYDWRNITLTWESLADVNVEVFLWYEDEQTFKKLWNVNSEKRTYTFRAVHDWDHILRLKPADGYQSINYTAHYLETQNPEVKPVESVKPVVVWPKENIMLIVFGTLILYVVYRISRRKA